MIYTLNLLYSIICSFCFSKYYNICNRNKFLLYFFYLSPVWTIWLFLCGGQYYVGTDYKTYYDIFKTQDLYIFHYNKEYLFIWITQLSGALNLDPQIPFYIFYFIGFVFFLLLLSRLEHKTSFIFILLYIAVSTVFNNQLNGLRQYIAIYICTFSVILLNGKFGFIKFILTVLLASMMHTSSLFSIPVILFIYKIKISHRLIKVALISSILFSIFGDLNSIISIFDFVIPIQYQHYLNSTLYTSNSITNILSKLIYIPFYWYSIRLMKNNLLKGNDLYLYKMGIISYSIRLFFLNNLILSRIGDLLILLTIFPLYYLLRDLYLRNKNTLFILISLFFISIYLVKVLVLAKQEYLYNSIYFL